MHGIDYLNFECRNLIKLFFWRHCRRRNSSQSSVKGLNDVIHKNHQKWSKKIVYWKKKFLQDMISMSKWLLNNFEWRKAVIWSIIQLWIGRNSDTKIAVSQRNTGLKRCVLHKYIFFIFIKCYVSSLVFCKTSKNLWQKGPVPNIWRVVGPKIFNTC